METNAEKLRPHFFEFTPPALEEWCAARGMPKFRARQIMEWVYQKGVAEPGKMTNLAAKDRDLLNHPTQGIRFLSGEIVRHERASDGTQKLLMQWTEEGEQRATDGSGNGQAKLTLPMMGGGGMLDSSRQTECVMIPADDERDDEGERGKAKRRTACVSSQVGCPVGCKFCASGIGGLDGNLSAGRIVEQVWRLGRVMDEPGKPGTGRITNVVFMGMGEPLSNFGNVTKAVRIMNAPWGLGISARKITISTVGLPRAIEKLAAELELPVTLALSLHAPNDAIRRELIPWAEYTTIPELTAACQKWFEKSGREITLEYILLRKVNDRPEHARELASVARSLRANVNLIRYNEVRGVQFGRPEDGDVLEFQRILRAAGVNTHIRASRGRDIAAACGQLRHEQSKRAADEHAAKEGLKA